MHGTNPYKSQVQLVHPVIVTVLTTVQYVLGGLGCSESQDLDGRQNDTMTRPETDRHCVILTTIQVLRF